MLKPVYVFVNWRGLQMHMYICTSVVVNERVLSVGIVTTNHQVRRQQAISNWKLSTQNYNRFLVPSMIIWQPYPEPLETYENTQRPDHIYIWTCTTYAMHMYSICLKLQKGVITIHQSFEPNVRLFCIITYYYVVMPIFSISFPPMFYWEEIP